MPFLLVYTCGASVLLALLSLYRLDSKPDFLSFMASVPGLAFLASIGALILGLSWIAHSYSRRTPAQRRERAMALAMAALSLILAIAAAEAVLRLLSTRGPGGTRIYGTYLYPRRWSDVISEHRRVLDRMAREATFIVHDPLLGWTLAPNRQDATGRYATSVEGLRSPRPGLTFSDARQRLSGKVDSTPSVRIALVGDSMTFGDEVPCEETWAHRLEEELGPDVQVLNFGVSGYGVSQSFLRYRRDVRGWHPDIVVMGITSEDLQRMMNLYNFLIYPTNVDNPFIRPRLIHGADLSAPINEPVPQPTEIFACPELEQLPYLKYDRFYNRYQWERNDLWRHAHRSYLFRLLTSLRIPADMARTAVSDDDLTTLSTAVLTTFVNEVRAAGATPLIVHLPYKHELQAAATQPGFVPPAVHMLNQTGVDFYDSTRCLIAAQAQDHFAPQGHYAAAANTALAACLGEVVQGLIGKGPRAESRPGSPPRRAAERAGASS